MSKSKNFPTVSLKEVPMSGPENGSNSYRPVVLVVDDESIIADTLPGILSRSGYHGIAAYDETVRLRPHFCSRRRCSSQMSCCRA